MESSVFFDWLQNSFSFWLHMSLWYAGFAVLFFLLSKKYPCNPEMRYWQRDNVVTDLCYWFLVPLVSKYVRLLMLVFAAQYILGLTTDADVDAYLSHGYGVIAALPLWVQAVLMLVLGDIALYWLHRFFHSRHMWKYHAVHHSPKHLDWASTQRFHPINSWLTFTLVDVALIMLGFSPDAFVLLIPFNTFFSAFVHANLRWTLGPFRYVLSSPVFHRWHHTMLKEGRDKNFAPTFPVLDIIFGTFYMPKGRLPEAYGVADERLTDNFVDQLFYPFR